MGSTGFGLKQTWVRILALPDTNHGTQCNLVTLVSLRDTLVKWS